MKKIAGITGIIIVAFAIIALFMNKLNKKAVAVSVIGVADGPTSVFLAGKVGETGENMSMLAIVGGVILIIALIVFLFNMLRKK